MHAAQSHKRLRAPISRRLSVFSGCFSEASSFHSVITQVLTKLLSWEMRLLCLVLQVIGIFTERFLFFSGQILYYEMSLSEVAQKVEEGGIFY